MNLTQQKSRNIISATWFLFFVINLGTVLYLRLDKWIETDDLLVALKHINMAYGGYLGVILMFYFISKQSKLEENEFKPSSFYVAFFCSVLWNLIIVMFLLPLAFGKGIFGNSLEIISDITSNFSWLIGGAIGYFFANNS